MFSQEDFELSNAQLGYGLTRTYNSGRSMSGMTGKGWSDSYHKEVYVKGNEIYFADSDGSIYMFEAEDEKTEPSSAQSFTCNETKEYTLQKTEGGYTVDTKDGTVYTFNEYGQLIKTTEPNGCKVENIYDNMGRLARVISTTEASLSSSLSFHI